MKTSLFALLLASLLGLTTAADGTTHRDFQVRGEVRTGPDGLTVTSKAAVIAIGSSSADSQRISVEMVLAANGLPAVVAVNASDWSDVAKPAAGRVTISRDKEGISLAVAPQKLDAATGKWGKSGNPLAYRYWPETKARGSAAAVEALTAAGLKPQTWHGRTLRIMADADRTGVNLWLDGQFVHRFERKPGSPVGVSLGLAAGDRLASVAIDTPNAKAAASAFVPLDLHYLANDSFAAAPGKGELKVAQVPFSLVTGPKNQVSLRNAQWVEWKKDPSSYYESYDYGPQVVGDPTIPLLRVPVADYSAVHLLAVADDDESLSNLLTLRCGRYGGAGQVVRSDFTAIVPRKAEAEKGKKLGVVNTPAGPLFHVRVPLPEAFAQDLEDVLEIELTKEVRLARRQPDPARFRTRPLGLPCGIRIAAVTLEKSPLQFRVSSQETGHAFVKPQTPSFQVKLENVSAVPQAYSLSAEATHLDGTKIRTVESKGSVEPGQTAVVPLALPDAKLGYHDLAVSLKDKAGRPLLERKTSLALLPPDTRKHRATSPFGTWDFFGGHYTCSDAERLGPLYVKLGMRYTMMRDPEARAKFGLLPGSEPKVLGSAEVYKKALEANPDTPHVGLLFHEDAISGPHLSRVPDLFTDRPTYKLNETEQKRFQTMWDGVTAGAKDIRKLDPRIHLRFGNGTLATKEEFYRNKFPAALFDSGGNEAGSFGRPPEAQPPDGVANNASLWMDRQLLDYYGYKDKPVTQCYEVIYPATNPGNLDERTQSDYLVRHALHSWAWGVPVIRPGCISDMGNSYYFSNWGATGFCRRYPELSVKPAFVSFATMTRVLDGAKVPRAISTGSDSVYALEFERPEGKKAYAVWTLRGTRPVKFRGTGAWTQVNDQGVETPLEAKDACISVTLSPSVAYLVGQGSLAVESLGSSQYTEKPAGKAVVLSPLDNPTTWTREEGRNPELEFYNMMTPRRHGTFAYEGIANLDGKKGAIRVVPFPAKTGKPTMPAYSVLAHPSGLAVPGEPTEVGVWVHGNSGWGRVMFELTDASGQRWVSLGAQQKGDSQWLTDMVPKDLLEKFPTPGLSDWNTEDVFGHSRINFDGWRYVAFPMPGNYPGEKYPWPANSQWRWDKDGVVHYPLTFRKLIVELPERVLKLTQYEPPTRADISLRELTVGYGAPAPTRTSAKE